MKYLLLFLLSFNLHAKDLTFQKSLVNIHTIAKSKDFKNKITSQGEIISNYLISITYKESITIFGGKDSLNQNIYGYYYGYRLTDNLNIVYGAYISKYKAFLQLDTVDYRPLKITDKYGLIPVIGIKQDINFYNNSKITIIYTPSLINISFGF